MGGEWTRRVADTTRRDLIDVMNELANEQPTLVRSVRAQRPTRRLSYPPLGDTYWMEHDGQFPPASWCHECGRPSAVNHRYVCLNHKRKDSST
jgi:hypothetical protein